MLATLTLQLTSTITTHEASADLTDTGTSLQHGKQSGQSPFSQLLGLNTDIAPDPEVTSGEFLPVSGKPLPPLRPSQLDNSLESTPRFGVPVSGVVTINPKLSNALDRDLELEIEVAYPPAEMTAAEPSHVTLLPIQAIPGAETLPASIKPLETRAETPARLGTDALTVTRPLQTLASDVSNALATQTQNLMAPGGDQTIVSPNTAGLARARILQANQQAPVAAAVFANGGIESADANQLAPFARTVGAIASVQKPDFRVAGLSSTQATAPAHLSPTISPFASDSGLVRQESPLQTISTPVRDAAWGQKLGEQLITLTGNQIRTAEIKLTPADLGPLRVQISIDEGATNVSFQAQHSVTREAIEQALPRLREMLAESGLSLGQTDVSEQGVSEREQERQFGSAASGDERVDDSAEPDHLERRKTVTSNNLLDTFV